MQNDNTDESDKEAAGSYSLTDSPFVGGNKMSSSLKDKLKRFRKYSSPISRPTPAVAVASRSIQFELPGQEYSKEEIENAMNEPKSLINESPSEEDNKILIDKPHSHVKRNAYFSPMEHSNEAVSLNPNEYTEICIEVTNPDENDSLLIKDDYENNMDKSVIKQNEKCCSISLKSLDNSSDGSDPEINDHASCGVKRNINKYIDEPVIKVEKDLFSYSKEDIENCVDKESLMKIFNNLQKDYVKNEEKFRKLKLVEKHHKKNSPDALKSLNQKWLTCTQSALRKLYSFMPEPRSITFETFLVFLQVDFNAVKYNPETDTFS